MRAIIVDDEPKAIELLESYLKYFGEIEVAATFRNALKAFEFLNKEKIDLVFLDINMPHLSGLSLSKMISPGTKIIFTTAYSEHAVESYEVNAVDYLLKPISLERFTQAIAKVSGSRDFAPAETSDHLMIKSGMKVFRVEVEDILYLKKESNYMMYHLKNQEILARESVCEALQALPDYFIQVHKSFIVNTRKIDFLDKYEISLQNKLIPIGASYKEGLQRSLKR